MAEYDWTTVVEVTITAGVTMTKWPDTLDARIIETGWHNT